MPFLHVFSFLAFKIGNWYMGWSYDEMGFVFDHITKSHVYMHVHNMSLEEFMNMAPFVHPRKTYACLDFSRVCF